MIARSSCLSAIENERPVVAVIGASGTGKSKLAIELAGRFEGECINADAMQIYSGLDIATNKVSAAEQQQCTHHMLGVANPFSDGEPYTSHHFQDAALKITYSLLQRNICPVLVGGTMYYVEAILFDHLVTRRLSNSSDEGSKQRKSENAAAEQYLHRPASEADAVARYVELQLLDPSSANRLHPHDWRKIARALTILKETGRPMSAHLEEQHALHQSLSISGPPRFRRSFMIWLDCTQDVLDRRLDIRVDEMVDCGLIDELKDFYKKLQESAVPFQNSGVLQSIGLKEFLPLLKGNIEDTALRAACISQMKLRTRQYARKQLTWIRNRFLKKRSAATATCPPIYRIDVTPFVSATNDGNSVEASERWKAICAQGVSIFESYSAGSPTPDDLKPINADIRLLVDDVVIRRTCDICSKLFLRESQWQKHVTCRSHEKAVKRAKSAQTIHSSGAQS